MNLKDNNLGTKITQQILMQSEHMGAKDFFRPPESLYNKNLHENVRFEDFYDSETNTYMKDFNNK